jgi:hypothetical protein
MALIPQVITEDRASGGQVVDGSLKFDGSSTTLTRTPGSASNQKTWTFSVWIKRLTFGASQGIFCPVLGGDGSNESQIRFYLDDRIQIYDSGGDPTKLNILPTQKFRDPSAWYHIVIACDTTQSTDSDRMKFYVNGTEVEDFDTTQWPDLNEDLGWNNTSRHDIGRYAAGTSAYLPAYMSNFYWIDGQQLDSSYFGFTDPLTNTWRPKKYTGTFGTNGFYLPMDGNSSIGQDKSGNGNDFTPYGFGNLNTIEKATGALPILNTTNGGNVATVGVRTDSNFSGLGLALPLVGTVDDVSNRVNNGSTTKTITKGNNVDADPERYNFYGGSHRFNGSTDYLDVGASSDFDFGTGDFTVECWIYSGVNSLDTYYRRIYMTDGPTGNATGNFQIAITPTSGVINLWEISGQLDVFGTTDVTNQKWNHIAAVRSGTTLKLYVNGVEELSTTYSTSVTANSGSPRPRIGNYNGGSGGGDFDGYMQDLRVYKGVAKYTSDFIPASTNPDILPDTPSGVSGGSALATLSESTTGGSVYFDGSGDYLSLADDTDFDVAAGDFTAEGYFYFTDKSTTGTCFFAKWANTPGRNYGLVYIKSGSQYRFAWSSNGTDETLYTSSGAYPGDVYRWVHIAVVRNGTTLKVYRDGKEIISASIGSSTIYNSSTSFMVGRFESNTNYDYSGWISNFRFVKGTAVYTSEFTPPTSPLSNITNTKLLCCKNSSSATASDVTPGTITANGTPRGDKFKPFQGEDINLVRGQESGWNTLNPLQLVSAAGGLSDGNLKSRVTPPTTGFCGSTGTLAVSSGKWYYEVLVTAASGMHGWVGSDWTKSDNGGLWYNSARGYGIYGVNGNKFNNGSNSSYGAAFANGDIISCALDLDNGFIMWAENGVWYNGGNPLTGANAAYTGLTGEFVTANFAQAANAGNDTPAYYNFGQKPFKYAPPEGFKTLCLANLPRPTEAAVRPDNYVGIVTYTALGGTVHYGSLNFQPDLVWLKARSRSSSSYLLVDSVRGATKGISSNLNTGDVTMNGSDDFVKFDPGGFTLGDSSNYFVNSIGDTMVAWCWKAGGAAVSNTDGNVTSTISVNQDAGFSIVSYASSTTTKPLNVGHGLGKKPDLILTKNRIQAASWGGYHSSTGATKSMFINSTGSGTVSGDYWNNTEPTDSVFTVYDSNNTHSYGTTDGFIAYCWTSIENFSKFGSYTANGSADGPFVYCGFRPALVWLKKTTSTSNWFAYDTSRNPYNALGNKLYLENSTNENGEDGGSTTSNIIDALSNGFKLRSANGTNNSGTYLFCAWAEVPTNNLFGGQANAR